MKSKKLFKRIVFGKLVKMPAEIKENMVQYIEPVKLSPAEPDRKFKVIFCIATLQEY